MKLKIVAYKDNKLNVFTNPFFLGNSSNEDIIENTRRMCANPKLPKVYYDYDLYCLGEYDDKTGHFDTKDPEFLVSLGDFRHLEAIDEVEKVDVVN